MCFPDLSSHLPADALLSPAPPGPTLLLSSRQLQGASRSLKCPRVRGCPVSTLSTVTFSWHLSRGFLVLSPARRITGQKGFLPDSGLWSVVRRASSPTAVCALWSEGLRPRQGSELCGPHIPGLPSLSCSPGPTFPGLGLGVPALNFSELHVALLTFPLQSRTA